MSQSHFSEARLTLEKRRCEEREKNESAHELECCVGDLEKEVAEKKNESEWWQRETESDVRVVELEREKEEVEARVANVEEKLEKLKQAARVQMEKSREAIGRRDKKIRELEDIVHEEVRSEDSSEEESDEEEGGGSRVAVL